MPTFIITRCLSPCIECQLMTVHFVCRFFSLSKFRKQSLLHCICYFVMNRHRSRELLESKKHLQSHNLGISSGHFITTQYLSVITAKYDTHFLIMSSQVSRSWLSKQAVQPMLCQSWDIQDMGTLLPIICNTSSWGKHIQFLYLNTESQTEHLSQKTYLRF